MSSNRITRRHALQLLAIGGSSALFSQCTCAKQIGQATEGPIKPPGSAGYSVIVIGAGMAGVACAKGLVRRGFSVVVLEAQNRVGGRVYTDRSLGFAVERGANWIEGESGNPVAKAARAHGVKTVVDDSDGAFYDFDGSKLKGKKLAEIEAINKEMVKQLEKLAEKADRDVPVERAIRKLLAKEKLSAFEERAVQFAMASVELDTAGGLERHSLWEADEGEAFGGESLFMPGGYDEIVKGVAKGLDIRFGEPVSEVAISDKGAVVTTTKGKHKADGVVVSVPLGVLKKGRIAFKPGLSAKKRKAIQMLGMGTLNKVILKFPKAFWPGDAGTFFYVSKERGELPQIVDWNRFGGQPALLLFQAGKFAREAEAWSDKQSVQRAMAVLKKCFGANVPDPTGFLVQRWNKDPWTFGSYSFLQTHATPEHRKALGAPEGERLYFCGEATHVDYPATVHGALLSGEREAKRIAEIAGV